MRRYEEDPIGDEPEEEQRQGHDPYDAGRRSKTLQIVTVFLLIVILLTAIFVLQNTQKTPIKFLWSTVEVPLSGALLLAAGLGGLLAFLVAYLRQRQFRKALRREQREHD